MAILTVNYSANIPITMDLANLASNANLLAGRESNEIDNTSTNYVDAIVSGNISVGATPTTGTLIIVYVWGSDSSLALTPINTLIGTNGARTLGNSGIRDALRLGFSIGVPATTPDLAYPILPFSVASLFGGVMPKYWGLFVTHNTVSNLRNTSVNTNSLEYVGIKYSN